MVSELCVSQKSISGVGDVLCDVNDCEPTWVGEPVIKQDVAHVNIDRGPLQSDGCFLARGIDDDGSWNGKDRLVIIPVVMNHPI